MDVHNIRLKKIFAIFGLILLTGSLTFFCGVINSTHALATGTEADEIGESEIPPDDGEFHLDIATNSGSTSLSSTLKILLVITVLTIAPSILLMVTSFTRIIIVLHFTRTAMGLQSSPPNQVMIGLALFLTFFIMSPTITEINNNAIQPFERGEITQE
jgi:flagellar biosynthetic protein FliP